MANDDTIYLDFEAVLKQYVDYKHRSALLGETLSVDMEVLVPAAEIASRALRDQRELDACYDRMLHLTEMIITAKSQSMADVRIKAQLWLDWSPEDETDVAAQIGRSICDDILGPLGRHSMRGTVRRIGT